MGGFWSNKRLARAAGITVLLAMVGYGAFLRVHDLGVSLYDDEINTRERAMQSAVYTLETRNYPLYYLLAKASLAFGDTEAALRLPSFIAGLLSIVAVYALVTRIHSRTAGLVAAGLIAFSPFHIHYSTFARYYALMMLFALLALWCLYGILERGRFRDWLGYIVAAFLALSSHVCFVPALAMMNVMAALYLLSCPSKGSLRRRAGLVCLLALCTATASGLLIQKNLHPSRVFDWAAKAPVATQAENAPAAVAPSAAAVAPAKASPALSRPRGGGLAVVDTVTGKTRYRLTFYDCVEYLKTYFWNNTVWLWPLLLVLGVWGFVDLWFRVPALAAPLTGGFLLGPLSLFVASTAHWYHARYLSYTYMFALVMVACGACVLPRFLSRALASPRSIGLWRRKPAPAGGRALTFSNVLYSGMVLGLAATLAPVLNEAYNTYPVDGYLPRGPLVENRAPLRDWKNLHRFTAQSVRDGDFFLFMTPPEEHGPRYTRYYLSRFLPWREEELRFGEKFGAPSPDLLNQLAREHPLSNLWFVGYQNYNARNFENLFKEIGADQVNLSAGNIPKGLRLFFLGAPTSNHIANGSFEQPIRTPLPAGVEKSTDITYAGATTLKITVAQAEAEGKESWETMFRMPVVPAMYRLRNNGFEAWTEGRPVGWKANTPSTVSMEAAGLAGTRSLKLAPAQETVILQQSIGVAAAPGRTLEVQAMGLSNTADNLHLVLRYAGPGFQEEVHTTHPGTGKWVRMSMEAPIPDGADPRSITIELWRMAGGDGDVLVDGVEMRVKDGGGSLDTAKPYVLSLALRSENLFPKRGSDMIPAGRVRLVWVDMNGQTGLADLMRIRNDTDWRMLSAVFQPGIDVPANLKELYLEAGIVDGTGTLWIDNVQLEEGTQPTPFTETFRLPHDETVGPRDLSAHAVEVPW